MNRYDYIDRSNWIVQWLNTDNGGSYPERAIDNDISTYADSGRLYDIYECDYMVTLPEPEYIEYVKITADVQYERYAWEGKLQVKTNEEDEWVDVDVRTFPGASDYTEQKTLRFYIYGYKNPVKYINFHSKISTERNILIWDIQAVRAVDLQDCSINVNEYLYRKELYITNNEQHSINNYILNFELDESIFNFNLCEYDGGDIVLTNKSNGYDICKYYITEFDLNKKYGRVWLEIDHIKPNETKTLYMFWGTEKPISFSNPDNLSFYAYGDFYGGVGAINLNTWERSYSRIYDIDGYIYVNDYEGYLRTKNKPLKDKKDWTVEICVNDSDDSRYLRLNTIGTENNIDLYIIPKDNYSDSDYQHNFINGGDRAEYSNVGDGFLDLGLDYIIKLSYSEKYDTVYLEHKNDMGYSFKYEVERKVEGDTLPKDLNIASGNYTSSVTIKWIYIYRKQDYNLDIDITNLFVPYEYVPAQPIDYDKYGEDVTMTSYYHTQESNALSDNNEDVVWYSNTISGSIMIDFGCKDKDLLDKDTSYFDSGHEKFLNIAKTTIDEDVNGNTFFQSIDESPWFCFSFREPTEVGCLNIEGMDEDSMINSFEVYGINDRPLTFVSEGWTLLHSGNMDIDYRYQTHRFNNFNKYKYYKIKVNSTHGHEPVKIKRIRLFENIGTRRKVISQLRLKPIKFGSQEIYFPKHISFSASNDLVNWTYFIKDRKTYTPFNDNYHNGQQRYSIKNDKAYWCYRLEYYGNWGGEENKIGIAEWEMVEKSKEESIYRILKGSTNNIKSIFYKPETKLLYFINDYLTVVDENFNVVQYMDVSDNIEDIVII